MKRVLLLLLIALLFISSSYFIIKTFNEYKNYLNIQKSEKSLVDFLDMDELLKRVENELSLSTIYMGSDGKSDFNALQIARDKTDEMIQKVTFIKDKAELKSDIRYVRSRVDVISTDYKAIIFNYYQDEIGASILKSMKKEAKELFTKSHNLQDYMIAYIDLIKFRNIINKEKSFITYILKQSKKMDKEDLINWDKMIGYQELFEITNLDELSNSQINNILKSPTIKDQVFSNRLKVALGANEAQYSISSDEWLKGEDELINVAQEAKITVFDTLKQKLTDIISSPEKIIIYLAIAIILILILFILIYKLAEQNYERKNIRISDNVLNARH